MEQNFQRKLLHMFPDDCSLWLRLGLKKEWGIQVEGNLTCVMKMGN